MNSEPQTKFMHEEATKIIEAAIGAGLINLPFYAVPRRKLQQAHRRSARTPAISAEAPDLSGPLRPSGRFSLAT